MSKKTGRLVVCCILGAAAVSCAVAGLAACGDGGEWDISADPSSSVTAQTVKTDDGLELRISGSGRMCDFAAGGAPWHKSAADITEITVANGIEYIGENAFEDIEGADYVILPSSVTAAGENFAENGLKIFVFNDDISFAAEPAELYAYREEAIQTNDRYWQSDKSSGDIIADGEDLTSADDGRYWRYVSADSDDATV